MWKLYGQITESFLERNPPLSLNIITAVSYIMVKSAGVIGERILSSTKMAIVKSQLPPSVVPKNSKIIEEIFKKKGISAFSRREG
tara:strand:- start:587 stop:841 length:255 start_codon:yes stop_codon:yes gene_type:complete